MRKIGHLDDVPHHYLTHRRIAFFMIGLLGLAAVADGLLLGYDAAHGRTLVVPLVADGVMAVVGMIAGGVFGWTNKKSPRWREWQKAHQTLTPGWPSEGRPS